MTELREAAAEIIAGFPRAFRTWHIGNSKAWSEAERRADAILTLPQIAALITDAEKWRSYERDLDNDFTATEPFGEPEPGGAS